MNLPDEGLVFDAQRAGPMNFADLRNADYGEGFRMATMPEIVSLIYASLENQDYDTAKNVIKTLRKGIIGNTGILYVPDGMFVEDNPRLKEGKISMNQKTLERRLGSHEERGVVFSDNGKIRFTPYNYIKKTQLSSQLSTNTGIIALVGGKENAEKLARVSGHYGIHPYFDTFENIRFSFLDRIACLRSDFFNNRLKINAHWDEGRAYEGYSFGVNCEDPQTK